MAFGLLFLLERLLRQPWAWYSRVVHCWPILLCWAVGLVGRRLEALRIPLLAAALVLAALVMGLTMRDFSFWEIAFRLLGGMEPDQLEFLENGVTLAASMAAWCVQNGVDVGFMANGENQNNPGVTVSVEPRCSQAHLERILEELSLLRIKMVLDIDTLLDKQLQAGITDMDLLIISAYWDERLEQRAQRLRRQNNSVTWLPIREGVNPS